MSSVTRDLPGSKHSRASARPVTPTRPEVGAKPALELGDGGEVGPYPPGKDIADGGVVDAGERTHAPLAPPGEGLSQPEGEEPRHLSRGVVAGDVGPVRTVSTRGWTSGPGHASTVDARAPR